MQAELEFVQALASPEYLHCTPERALPCLPARLASHTDRARGADLAQHRYLDDPRFIAYLGYLQYWRRPPYCTYLVFPHCLRMLELLQVGRAPRTPTRSLRAPAK